MNKTMIIKVLIGAVLGGLVGYGYYYFVGCQGGCPLTSSWVSSTLFGIGFGAVLFYPNKKAENEKD